MPLLDHFHPPVTERRTWEGFHGLWAAALVEKLNRDVLGEEYFADMQVHVGSAVEVDIATLQERVASGGGSATAVAPAWAPPATSLVLPTIFPDEIEVQVYSTVTGAQLVAAIELVSPGNKDRPETRQAFAAKCVGYLTRGIGLIVVDMVTNRQANLLDVPRRERPRIEDYGRKGARVVVRTGSRDGLCDPQRHRIGSDALSVTNRSPLPVAASTAAAGRDSRFPGDEDQMLYDILGRCRDDGRGSDDRGMQTSRDGHHQ